jgi:hypothetical protein
MFWIFQSSCLILKQAIANYRLKCVYWSMCCLTRMWRQSNTLATQSELWSEDVTEQLCIMSLLMIHTCFISVIVIEIFLDTVCYCSTLLHCHQSILHLCSTSCLRLLFLTEHHHHHLSVIMLQKSSNHLLLRPSVFSLQFLRLINDFLITASATQYSLLHMVQRLSSINYEFLSKSYRK